MNYVKNIIIRIAPMALIACLLLSTGCVSKGIIGPFSYLNSSRVQKAAYNQQIKESGVDDHTKNRALNISAMGGSPNEIGIRFGLDLFQVNALQAAPASQWAAIVGDVIVYGVATYYATDSDSGSSSSGGGSSKGDGNVGDVGDGSTVNITIAKDNATASSSVDQADTSGDSNFDEESSN